METLDQKLSTAEVCKRIQTALDNMGRALKCPVCLSTLRDKPVVLSSCVHAFCHSCLMRSFESTKETCCPICKIPCHRRRSVSEAPFLGKLAHSYQRTLRHFGLTPVKYTTALPLLTQLGPEENYSQQQNDVDVAMVHRHFQVSKTFEMAMRQDRLASRNTILQQHQSVVEANGKVLLETIVKRKNVDVKKPTVQFALNVADPASSDAPKEEREEIEGNPTSAEKGTENSESTARSDSASLPVDQSIIDDNITSNKSCLKSTPSLGEQKLAIQSSASKLSVQFQSLSPILAASHDSPALSSLQNVNGMTGKVDERSSQSVESIPPKRNDTDTTRSGYLSVAIQQSSTVTEPEGEMKTPTQDQTSKKPFDEKSKQRHETPETDKSSESIFPESASADTTSFQVGDIIDVKPRTWPGINKHGGTAKIVKVNDDKSYDVSFCSIHRDSLPDRKKDSIPICLLQQLASEGFDVQGNQTERQEKAEPARSSKARPLTVKKREREPAAMQNITSSGKEERTKRSKLEQRNEAADLPPPSLEHTLKLSISETNSLADSLYQSRIAAAITQQQVVIITSGLSDYDATRLKELEKLSKKWEVSVKVSNAFNAKRVTLCLTPVAPGSKEDSAIARRRTMKGMQCALAGIPLVSSKWIQRCMMESKVVLPSSSMYIRALPSETGKCEHGVAVLAAFQQQSKFSPLPLQHCQVFSFRNTCSETKDTNVILSEAGAGVVSNAPALLKVLNTNVEPEPREKNEKIIVVCDDVLPRNVASCLQSLHHQFTRNVWVVNSSWIFDSVSAGKVLTFADYPPSHISARPFWERTNTT